MYSFPVKGGVSCHSSGSLKLMNGGFYLESTVEERMSGREWRERDLGRSLNVGRASTNFSKHSLGGEHKQSISELQHSRGYEKTKSRTATCAGPTKAKPTWSVFLQTKQPPMFQENHKTLLIIPSAFSESSSLEIGLRCTHCHCLYAHSDARFWL